MAQAQTPATRQGSEPEQQVAGREVAERTRTRPVYAARADIYEVDEGLVIEVDMPGVRPDAVDVTLEKRVLTIRGSSHEQAPEGFSPVYREYRPGDYERSFTLSDELDAERIEAKVKNGILRLFLPKAAAAQAKRIQIRPD
jgi:HSP20 family protein